MLETARLAGFFAAHGLWSVADGGPLTPLLGFDKPDGGRGMTRYAAPELEIGVKAGQDALAANPDGAVRAALVYDAFLHLPSGRIDALVIEAVEYGPQERILRMGVPYRPEPFAVYRPKFLEVTGVDRPDWAVLGGAFFEGVDSHEQAAAIWNAHLGESL
ncbi:hypothetical protein [Actinoplanes ianthinogenes]|nr:hypothetical protein [Actinoplanes ianthinogenes]